MDDFAQSVGSEPITIEMLLGMGRRELEALYAEASAPGSLEALDGDRRGFILAVTGLEFGPLASWRRRLGGSAKLPWRGKSFRSVDAERGAGANRFQLLGEVAAFATSIGPSAIDGAPCVRLDYDQPGNPWPISAVRDELREVAPGLYFGPAMLELAGRRVTFLYFAVELGAP